MADDRVVLPASDDSQPLGCHNPKIPDRVQAVVLAYETGVVRPSAVPR